MFFFLSPQPVFDLRRAVFSDVRFLGSELPVWSAGLRPLFLFRRSLPLRCLCYSVLCFFLAVLSKSVMSFINVCSQYQGPQVALPLTILSSSWGYFLSFSLFPRHPLRNEENFGIFLTFSFLDLVPGLSQFLSLQTRGFSSANSLSKFHKAK